MLPRARTLVNVVLAALALAYTTSAAPPDWWQTRGVMDASQTHNDFAAANTGQLKHIAQQAMLEMDAHLIGGAGTAIHQLVDAWPQQTTDRNDFAAVNVGQVKAVAKLFYDRLNQVGLALPLPWTPTEPEKNDFAAVNIGQLKNIFAFKVPTVTTLDLDSDGIHDWWVNHFFPQNSSLLSQSSSSDDPDHDLLTNAEEFKNGTNPNSGADGLVIQLEVFQRSGFARSGGFMHLATDNTPFRSRKYTSTFEATHEGGIPYSESFSWSIDETYTHPIVTGTLVALLNQPAYELMAMVTETTSGDITRVPSFDFYYLFDLVDEDHVEEAVFNRHSYYYEPQSPTSQGSAELAHVTEYASPITAAEMFAALESDLYPISPAPEIIHSNTYASVATRNQGPNFYAVDASICEYRYVLRSKNGANLLLDAPKNVMWIESVEVALNGLEYGGPHNAQIRNAALNLGNATPLHALDARPYIASGPPGNITAYHRVNLLPADLDVAKISHNATSGELDDSKEESTGAFIPLNSDDDDYSAIYANPGSDKDQTGSITGENDLLPIYLKKLPQLTGAKFLLDIPSKIKVWKNSNRHDEVLPTTELDASVDTTVYAEGVSKGSDLLKLNLRHGGQDKADIARLKVTVFELKGVLNVPGYSAYNYTTEGPLPTGSKWGTPTSGSAKPGSTASQATILWDEGPVVGKAVYEVNSDYIWDLEVNVVQVKIKQTGNTATYNSAPFQRGGLLSALIGSNSWTNAMTARVVVDTVQGPTINGAQRGKKFMELGIVHQAGFDAKHGLYDDSFFLFPNKRKRSSMQDGQTHWDAATVTTLPWALKDADHHLDITSDSASVTNQVFKTFDEPEILGTYPFTLSGDQVDRLAINMFHNLYFAVRTKQNVNSSYDSLTQRCILNWRFDGSGSVDASGKWTLTGTGVTGDPSFSEVTNGDTIPNAAANINEAFQTETWATENQ